LWGPEDRRLIGRVSGGGGSSSGRDPVVLVLVASATARAGRASASLGARERDRDPAAAASTAGTGAPGYRLGVRRPRQDGGVMTDSAGTQQKRPAGRAVRKEHDMAAPNRDSLANRLVSIGEDAIAKSNDALLDDSSATSTSCTAPPAPSTAKRSRPSVRARSSTTCARRSASWE